MHSYEIGSSVALGFEYSLKSTSEKDCFKSED